MPDKIKNLKDRTDDELIEIYDMVRDEISDMLDIIKKKSGYYVTCQYLLFGDEPKKCMDIDLKIALLERPHEPMIDKMEYYAKVNPDNCLKKNVIAHEHNSWYMIYDGVHRTEANKSLGEKSIKADIIVPNPKDVKPD